MGDKKDRITGKVKETTGRAVDDKDLEAEGRGEQVKGDVKAGVEKLKDAAKKA
jgi:uncharacterized protein YjbJ (UPF0337 family)